jgi:hypothetical protein
MQHRRIEYSTFTNTDQWCFGEWLWFGWCQVPIFPFNCSVGGASPAKAIVASTLALWFQFHTIARWMSELKECRKQFKCHLPTPISGSGWGKAPQLCQVRDFHNNQTGSTNAESPLPRSHYDIQTPKNAILSMELAEKKSSNSKSLGTSRSSTERIALSLLTDQRDSKATSNATG